MIIKRYKNIDKIPGLVSHIEKTWGMGHATWIFPERWWFIGFSSGFPLDKNSWVCYGGCYSYGMSDNHYVAVLGPTYIAPDYRGQGIQFELLQKRIKFLKGLEYTKLWSSTYADNYPSMKNLAKAGFYIVPPWCKAEENSIYWEKAVG